MDINAEIKHTGRGIFLWVILANAILVTFARLLSVLFPHFFANIYAGGPHWDYVFNLLAFVLEASGIIGIILWKRWGLFLMVVSYLAEAFVDFAYFVPRPSIAEG